MNYQRLLLQDYAKLLWNYYYDVIMIITRLLQDYYDIFCEVISHYNNYYKTIIIIYVTVTITVTVTVI